MLAAIAAVTWSRGRPIQTPVRATATLVETAAGGTQGGGARLTELGRTVLTQYRALERRIAEAAQGEAWNTLRAEMLHQPKQSQKD